MTDDSCDLLCLDLPQAEAVRVRLAGDEQIRVQAARAKALADPTRLRIAAALGLAELCVCDLAWVTELPEKTVSHHCGVLRGAGLAESQRQGKLVMYRLTDVGHRLLAAVTGEAVAR